MPKPIIAGNWKMHGTRATVAQLLVAIQQGLATDNASQIEWLVLPPYVFLPQVESLLRGSVIKWGAQNVSAEALGAFTGEIAASMLAEFQCEYVLIGHSERRILYGENDGLVARKFVAAKQAGLKPILCVGETLAQNQQGLTQAVITKQLAAIIAGLSDKRDILTDLVIAYEPVWAIGTGKTATPEQAQAVHAMIRAWLQQYDAKLAAEVRIIYGGSVKAENAAALFAMPDINGALVGGASLRAEEFVNIGRALLRE